MYKLLAMAILGSGMAQTFGPAMNPADNIFKKNKKDEEQSVLKLPSDGDKKQTEMKQKSSSNAERETKIKQKGRCVAYAPAFDGLRCFETLVLY